MRRGDVVVTTGVRIDRRNEWIGMRRIKWYEDDDNGIAREKKRKKRVQIFSVERYKTVKSDNGGGNQSLIYH